LSKPLTTTRGVLVTPGLAVPGLAVPGLADGDVLPDGADDAPATAPGVTA
jgi:hypothetical protein